MNGEPERTAGPDRTARPVRTADPERTAEVARSAARVLPVRRSGFGEFVARAHARGQLVVQPRMGFSDPEEMRGGLLATKRARATTVGTLTLDSYTRVGEHDAARRALAAGVRLNGYPIVAHGTARTGAVLDGALDEGFPVQVRHGSARPQRIMTALAEAGLHATEGGPASYCLPYGRVPLRESVENWVECCRLLGSVRDFGEEPHLETFGGCMMGQLCPPSLLVAISLLEGLFFCQNGVTDVSLSYAQQTSGPQDEEAVAALRRLAAEFLPTPSWHIVVYTYMGVFPQTPEGAADLLAASARLAVRSGASRLIVKTSAEAFGIPTVGENVTALEHAARVAAGTTSLPGTGVEEDSEVYAEARAFVEAVLDLDGVVARSLPTAFERGYLDVPFCLHPDNAGLSRSTIDDSGRLRWTATGSMPLGRAAVTGLTRPLTSAGLLTSLSYVQRGYDRAELGRAAGRSITTVPSSTPESTRPQP
ncbi:glutamate mutase subunit E [Streptomyces sp. 1114.5]|uniref:methylaspartate mutase n=1 Tax=Streptomyces sp. 1114.5 TaxID=1938830 RepID=UPI000EB0F5C6|nr:methylaspartate mutase [Streptomyces sp. 1114.5]RKT19360.1 glutamate mutase subunit E [Streptomyces sp. 1114.5]